MNQIRRIDTAFFLRVHSARNAPTLIQRLRFLQPTDDFAVEGYVHRLPAAM